MGGHQALVQCHRAQVQWSQGPAACPGCLLPVFSSLCCTLSLQAQGLMP